MAHKRVTRPQTLRSTTSSPKDQNFESPRSIPKTEPAKPYAITRNSSAWRTPKPYNALNTTREVTTKRTLFQRDCAANFASEFTAQPAPEAFYLLQCRKVGISYQGLLSWLLMFRSHSEAFIKRCLLIFGWRLYPTCWELVFKKRFLESTTYEFGPEGF